MGLSAPDFSEGKNLGRPFESIAEIKEVAGEPVKVTGRHPAYKVTGASDAAMIRIEFHRPVDVRVDYVDA